MRYLWLLSLIWVGMLVAQTPVPTPTPLVATAVEGQRVTLSATASGTRPMNWEWYFAAHGQEIAAAQQVSGATSSVYVVASVAPQHAGSYYVRVSNVAGSAQSSEVVIVVQALAPTVTPTPSPIPSPSPTPVRRRWLVF